MTTAGAPSEFVCLRIRRCLCHRIAVTAFFIPSPSATVVDMTTKLLFNRWTYFALGVICATDAFMLRGFAKLANGIAASLLLGLFGSVSRRRFSVLVVRDRLRQACRSCSGSADSYSMPKRSSNIQPVLIGLPS